MQKRAGRLIHSPSDLIVFLESPFASWMDRLQVERRGTFVPDGADAQMSLVATMGNAHEARVLDAMRASGRQVWQPETREHAFTETLDAMHAGFEIIYQAALRDGDFEGHADFLRRVPGTSALGRHRYEIIDTKLARKPKPYFLLQLCAYAAMVEQIQGAAPEHVHIITGDNVEHAFRHADYVHYFRALRDAFLEAQASFDPERPPTPAARAEHRRWASHAARKLEELDHPSRVANITSVQVKRLASAGIHTMTELATTTIGRVARLDDRVLDRLRRQARLQKESAGKDVPLYEAVPRDDENPRRGLALLPAPSRGDIFFDMEGYPFAEGGLEYLFGATHVERGKRKFYEQWAHDPASEKRAFEEFVDWAFARFQADPSMHIYHYAPYEVTALRRLMGTYATREKKVDVLLRNEVFVDLYRVVKQGMLVGEPRYSLKNVEHLYRPARAGEVATAGDSVVEYAKWLETPDGADWQSSKILSTIRDYNIEDCDSTLELRDWLLERQREAYLVYLPEPVVTKKDDCIDLDPLVEGLRADIPEDTSADHERWRVQAMLADLVDFHHRESKPVFWAKFDRLAKSDEELAEDEDCLGAITRTAKEPEVVMGAKGKSTQLYEYSFDPMQGTKLREGSECFFTNDQSRCTITSLDLTGGRVVVNRTRAAGAPPLHGSLIPDEFVRPSPCDTALRGVIDAYAVTHRLSGPVETLLKRLPPKVRGSRRGAPLPADVTKLIANLDGTTLAIQGPPGSGKTTTAARAIVELVRQGKRVGITGTGHAVIENVLRSVVKLASGQPIRLAKVGGSSEEDLFANGLVTHTSSIKNLELADDDGPQVVGGTAWAFCNEAAIGAFDVLFVDEASQIPLANVVAMSRSTRNIVLVGDQMQLASPLKGAHPGESGTSALGYLLGDQRTIPRELGVFLDRSWRMHPEVCRVVSEAVYEGRLEADPENATRIVRVPPGGGSRVNREAGVVFVPVEHEGNSQSSDEEVEVVRQLVDELIGRELVEKGAQRTRRVTAADILVVAPYNMQVRALQNVLPDGVRVASVDKFQGQEATIAIVSMCASSTDEVPRGLDFLLSANRLNVALSRAQSLAIVVASPALRRSRVSSVAQMRLVSFFCRVSEE